MAININRYISAYNSSSRGGSKIEYIVIHYVGSVSTAYNNAVYFAGGDRQASAHLFVNYDGAIWQSVEFSRAAWHCGGGLQGSGGHAWYGKCKNSNSIGIEMCVNRTSSGTWYFEDATVKATIELTKYLMSVYGIPASNVIRHYDVTGKICPEPYVYNNTKHTWSDFKAAIGGSYSGGSVTTDSPETRGYLMLGDTGTLVKDMQTKLIYCGYSCGASGADGSFGNDTLVAVKKFQEDNGLVVDGYFGNKTKQALAKKYEYMVEQSKLPKQVAGKPVNDEQLWYRAHCQTVGYLAPVRDGQTAGTTGYSKRIEALRIDLRKVREKYPDAKLAAKVHIQGIGWKYFENVEHDTELGTTGQGKRIEAIELELTGVDDKDIYYRTHVAGTGWTGWIKGGFTSGTVGISKAIEAIQIKIE